MASSRARGDKAADAHGCGLSDELQRLVHLLPSVMRGLRRQRPEPVSPQAARLGARHRSVLTLVQVEPRTMGSLAADLRLTLPTTSGLVADLEDAGFVERSPDPADRRRTLVGVAPNSSASAQRWLEGSTVPILRALERLSPGERAVFVRALEHLDAELRQASG